MRQWQSSGTTASAPTLYEYDSFGNITKQTLALSVTPTKDNSSVMAISYSVESSDDGVFSVSTHTRYSAAGQPLSRTQKQLLSQLSDTLAEKVISINERGLTSADGKESTVNGA